MEQIIVIRDALKMDYLKQSTQTLSQQKVYGQKEFIQKLFFNYAQADYYLVQNHQYSLEVAQELLTYIPFVNSQNAKTTKLQTLFALQTELISEGLYQPETLFKKYLSNKTIILKDILPDARFKHLTNLNFEIENEPKNHYIHTIYHFDTVLDEVLGFFETVTQAIKNGTPPQSIKVIVRNETILQLCHQFKQDYGISIDENKSYNGSPMLNKYIETNDLSVIIDPVLKQKILNTQNSLINLIPLSQENKQKLLNAKLSKLQNIIRYINSINFVSLDGIKQDDTIFVLGFNEKDYPFTPKLGYLTQQETQLLSINTTQDELANEKTLITQLATYPNVYLSYSEISDYQVVSACPLLEAEIINYTFKPELFSASAQTCRLAQLEHNFRHLNHYQDDLSRLYYAYPKSPYNTYSHQYNGHYQPQQVTLSYTSLQNYNLNPFSYFVTHVLNIKNQNQTFSQALGSYLHEVLQNCTTLEQYQAMKPELIRRFQFSAKEQIWLQHLEPEIIADIQSIQNYHQFIDFDEIIHEANIELELLEGVTFKGFIDKFLIKDNRYLVVDYKKKATTATKTLQYIDYGLHNQLFLYCYLVEKTYPQLELLGVFYQYLLMGDIKLDNGDNILSYELEKQSSLKMTGIVNDDVEKLVTIDPNLFDHGQQRIKLRLKKDATLYANEKAITLDPQKVTDNVILKKDLIERIEKRLIQNANDIKQGHFPIQLTMIDGKEMDQFQHSYHRLISYCDEFDLVEKGDQHVDRATTTSH